MTGMALAHCILGKFLGVVCHCFPPPLDVPIFAARCLYVRNDATDPSSERWNCGREICPVILPKFRLPRKFRVLYMPQIYDMGTTALLLLRRKACLGFFRYIYIYIYTLCMYNRKKRLYQGHKIKHFNYTVRSVTLYNLLYTYVHKLTETSTQNVPFFYPTSTETGIS